MELLEIGPQRLVLEKKRGGLESKIVVVLGVGFGLLLLIPGLMFFLLPALLLGSLSWSEILIGMMLLVMGAAFMAAFKNFHQKTTRETRVIITGEEGVRVETFDPQDKLESSETFKVYEGSYLLGRMRVVRLPNAGSSGTSSQMEFYDTLLVGPDGNEVLIEKAFTPADAQLRLLQIRKVLNLPVRLEGFPRSLKPAEEQGRVSERMEVVRQRADGKDLEIRLRPTFGEVLWRSGVPLFLAVTGGLAAYWQFHFGGMREDSFTLIAVFTIAAVAIIFLRAAILSQTRVVEDLQISPSGWIWKTFGKETLANSIEDLEAMVLWSDRLQLFFPRQARALLLGFSESHDERCYLFNEILTTLEANGYSLPEVPWETSG